MAGQLCTVLHDGVLQLKLQLKARRSAPEGAVAALLNQRASPRRPGTPRSPRRCHPADRSCRVRAREATAERLGLDTADAGEIIESEEDGRLEVGAGCDGEGGDDGGMGVSR